MKIYVPHDTLNKSMPEKIEYLPPVDYREIKTNFTNQLKEASLGYKESISFIRHRLPRDPLVQEGVIQGIVIGGTNYISSTEKILPNGAREVLQKKTGVLPVFKNKDTFISFLRAHHDKRAQAVGLNFGFPMNPVTGPHGELDGKLLTGTKEHAFAGMLDKPIGDMVRDIFNKDVPVACANDTVCLTLAGDGTEDGSIIAGTGFNIGLTMKENGEPVVANLEAGNFNGFPKTEVLQAIDEQSDLPGTQLFEKIISGKYLAEFFNIKAQRLGLTLPPLTTSQELSALSNAVNDEPSSILARALLERSAFHVAASVASVYEFKSQKSITLIGEGSLLWKGWNYMENVQNKLTDLGVPENGVVFKHIKDSSIKGAVGLVAPKTS